MTDHLPECIQSPGEPVGVVCICDRLRAAEARLREGWCTSVCGNLHYAAGVQDARDAVKNTPCPEGYEAKGCSHWDEALAAIDALRGEL